MLESQAQPFGAGSSQFMMTVKLCMKKDEQTQFVVGQTHLKAKPAFIKDRVTQCQMIKEYFDQNHQDIPCFMAGDFNEEPQNEPITVMKQSFIDLFSTINDNHT